MFGVPTQHLVKELVLQMLKRMKHRTEANPYQSVAFHLKTFPLSVAKTIFPEEQLESSTPTSKTWVLDSATKVAMVLGPLMSAHGLHTAGHTKSRGGLQGAQDSVATVDQSSRDGRECGA